jgi:hypothetical protein
MPTYAWLPLALACGLQVLWGLLSLSRGEPNTGLARHAGHDSWSALVAAEPGTADVVSGVVRAGASASVGLGIACLAVTLLALRQAQAWAWWTLWVLVAVNVLSFGSDLVTFRDADPGTGTLGPVYLLTAVLAAAGLVLGARRALSAGQVNPDLRPAP